MPAFLALFLQLLPYLPSIIGAVQQMHGPTTLTNGPQKLATAVGLVQILAPEIAPHLTDDPAKLKLVQDVIGVSVSAMKLSGMMPTVAAPTTAEPLGQPSQVG